MDCYTALYNSWIGKNICEFVRDADFVNPEEAGNVIICKLDKRYLIVSSFFE